MTAPLIQGNCLAPRRQLLRGHGLYLAADVYGPESGQPVLFFHGGGQSRKSWSGSARILAAAGYRTFTIDLRGHGESEWAEDGDYLLDAFARDVETLIDSFDKPVVLVGASRGGQSALVGGSRRPGRVKLLMLADVAPAMRDEGIDDIRAFFDASKQGFSSIKEAADALAKHLGHKRMTDTSGLKKAMRNGNDGRLYWQWDPKSIAPEFIHPPSEGIALVEAAACMIDPVVLVHAELSTIVTDQSVAKFRELTPHLEVEIAPGVGHMFTGDRNDDFSTSLLERLSRL